MSDLPSPTDRETPVTSGWDWTVENLRKLDWKRWQALAVAVLERNGYIVSPERVRPDGTRLYSLSRSRDEPVDSLLLLGGSDEATPVGQAEIDLLCQEMEAESVSHGVLATVWPVSADVASQAAAHRIMVIDGAGFLANVAERSAEDLSALAAMAAEGDWTTPTCPACAKKMRVAPGSEVGKVSSLPDLTFAASETVYRAIRAATIIVQPDISVIFTGPVVASKLVVGGVIEGQFIVDGPVIIEPDSVLRGKVTARSIDAREGAELDGEASIVSSAALQAMMPPEPATLWICPDFPKCRGTAPLRPTDSFQGA